MNALMILACLISWGATPAEAMEELGEILSKSPSLEFAALNANMLKYEETWFDE